MKKATTTAARTPASKRAASVVTAKKAAAAPAKKTAASSRASSTSKSTKQKLSPIIPVADMREEAATREIAKVKKSATLKPKAAPRAKKAEVMAVEEEAPMKSVRASKTVSSSPASRSTSRGVLRSSTPRRVHPDILSSREMKSEPLMLAETFMSEGSMTGSAPRKTNGIAITIGLFSIVAMGLAGMVAFGPSHADELPAGEISAVTAPMAVPPTPAPISDANKSGAYTIIGKVNTINADGTISLTTLSPSGSQANTKDYTIRLDENTSYFHQVPSKQDKGVISYSVVRGEKAGIQPGYFVSLTTNDDTVKDTALLAATVNYSEMSPFDDAQ